MTSREFQERLSDRAGSVGVELACDVADRLEAYYRLLAIWNQRINLTALPLADAPSETLDRLLIEPVVAAKHVPSGTDWLLDIGSGGGSPALPLAVAMPGIRLRMVESRTRKSVFLREAARALGLKGAEVVTSRFGELIHRPGLLECHGVVTARAIRIDRAEMAALLALLTSSGQLLFFRSASARNQNEQAPNIRHLATHTLVRSTGSELAVFEKIV